MAVPALPELDDDLVRAVVAAAVLHRGQLRKGTDIPYLSHVMAVGSIVMEAGGTRDQQIAALLHDAVEDTDATVTDIDALFGPAVASIVQACSDTEVRPKPPWRARKQKYLTHLVEAASEVLLVSLADKVHNARSILRDYRDVGPALWERFSPESQGAIGQLWYYRSLLCTFASRSGDLAEPSRYLVSELAAIVADLEAAVAVREPETLIAGDATTA